MPAVHELMKDIPDDDEGPAEQSMERRLQRVHRNLGHPPNRLLVQILKEAKAPDSVIELAKYWNVHYAPDMFAPPQRGLRTPFDHAN